METAAGETVILKIIVPSSSVSKTVRLPPKTKIKELHETLSKKLSSLGNTPQSLYDDFGFCWHSDSGPLWLADGSSLRAYNLKNNVSIEFKKRPVSSAKSVVQGSKSKGGSKKDNIVQTDGGTKKTPESGHGESLRAAAVRKMSGWVSSSRPGSLYDLKKESKKEPRAHSVTLIPRKDPEAINNNASRYTSPSFSTPSTLSTFESAPLSPPSTLEVSPRSSEGASLDDLDDLIDIFDDLAEGDEFSNERLLEEYAATLEHEDIYEGAAESQVLPKSETDLSSSPSSFSYSPPSSPSPSLPSYSPTGSRRSYSPLVNPPLQAYNPRLSAHSSPPAYSPSHSLSPSPNYSSSPIESPLLEPTNSSQETDEEDLRKMPGLRGSGKRDPDPSTNMVRVAAAKSILEDALGGIESGTVDMALMKHYVTSALCILKTLS